jgi:hypothetical protein
MRYRTSEIAYSGALWLTHIAYHVYYGETYPHIRRSGPLASGLCPVYRFLLGASARTGVNLA